MSDVTEATVETQEIDIAAVMAKSGKTVDGSSFFSDNNNEQKPEVPAKQVETTATPEVKEIVQETKPVEAKVEPAKQPESAPVQDWTEVLKQKPDTEVLKALGFEDKWIGLLNHAKGGGDLKEYMEALSTDISKMSAEDVMRRQLRAEHPEMDKEDFDEYYRMKVTETYKLDPDMFSETDVKRGKIMLNADVKKIREQMVTEQQKYLLSPIEAKPSPEVAAYKAEKEQSVKDLEAYKNALTNDPYVKEFVKTKKIKIGDGEDSFIYESKNPQNVLDVLIDGKLAAQKLRNGDGSHNIQKQTLIGAILDDDLTLFTELAKHYKTIGGKEALMPIENASGKIDTPAKAENFSDDPVAAMAKSGKITSGSW